MKNKLCVLLLISLCSFTVNRSGEDVLRQMHDRYSGKWHKTFTFTQTTEQYRNDSLLKTSTWYEAIVFPDKFRIDFGKATDSNAVIYLKDSVYSFRKGKLARTSFNETNLTFLLGGMYFYSFDSVKLKIAREGYDLSKSHENTWKGKPVYVIGATNASEKTNQLWIDKENLFILKFIKFNGSDKEEGILYNHKKIGNVWAETGCDFYVNDKLIQKETYFDCKENVEVDLEIFDPYHFKGRSSNDK